MHKLDFSVVVAAQSELLMGAVATLALAGQGIVLAMLIGVTGVAAKEFGGPALDRLVSAFVELIRNTPFLVQIFFIFFALPLIGIRLSPTVTAVIALGVNGGAYAIEIIRGGLGAVGKGIKEAGFALGLSNAEVFFFVLLKPTIRAVYPSIVSQFVSLTLTTSIAVSISANELTYVAQTIESQTFKSFEVYLTTAVIYLVISWLVMMSFAAIASLVFRYPTR